MSSGKKKPAPVGKNGGTMVKKDVPQAMVEEKDVTVSMEGIDELIGPSVVQIDEAKAQTLARKGSQPDLYQRGRVTEAEVKNPRETTKEEVVYVDADAVKDEEVEVTHEEEADEEGSDIDADMPKPRLLHLKFSEKRAAVIAQTRKKPFIDDDSLFPLLIQSTKSEKSVAPAMYANPRHEQPVFVKQARLNMREEGVGIVPSAGKQVYTPSKYRKLQRDNYLKLKKEKEIEKTPLPVAQPESSIIIGREEVVKRSVAPVVSSPSIGTFFQNPYESLTQESKAESPSKIKEEISRASLRRGEPRSCGWCEDSDQTAVYACAECGLDFCEQCATQVHSRGNFVHHPLFNLLEEAAETEEAVDSVVALESDEEQEGAGDEFKDDDKQSEFHVSGGKEVKEFELPKNISELWTLPEYGRILELQHGNLADSTQAQAMRELGARAAKTGWEFVRQRFKRDKNLLQAVQSLVKPENSVVEQIWAAKYGGPSTYLQTAQNLAVLSADVDNQVSIVERGALDFIQEWIQTSHDDPELMRYSAITLVNCSSSDFLMERVNATLDYQTLADMAKSQQEDIMRYCSMILCNLAAVPTNFSRVMSDGSEVLTQLAENTADTETRRYMALVIGHLVTGVKVELSYLILLAKLVIVILDNFHKKIRLAAPATGEEKDKEQTPEEEVDVYMAWNLMNIISILDKQSQVNLLREGGIQHLGILLRNSAKDAQQYAIITLARVASADYNPPPLVRRMIFERGLLPKIHRLVKSKEPIIRNSAVLVIANMASVSDCQRAIIDEGVLQSLLNVHKDEDPDLKRYAALLYGNLSSNVQLQGDIIKSGMRLVIALLSVDDVETQKYCLLGISNLCVARESCKKMLNAESVPVLCQIVAQGQEETQDIASKAIVSILLAVLPDTSMELNIPDETLSKLLEQLEQGGKVTYISLSVLFYLSKWRSNGIALCRLKSVTVFLKLMQSSDKEQVQKCAAILTSMSGFDEVKEELFELLTVPVLENVMNAGGNTIVSDLAMQIFSNLVSYPKNYVKAVETGAGALVLRILGGAELRKSLLAIRTLACLTSHEQCRVALLKMNVLPSAIREMNSKDTQMQMFASLSVANISVDFEACDMVLAVGGAAERILYLAKSQCKAQPFAALTLSNLTLHLPQRLRLMLPDLVQTAVNLTTATDDEIHRSAAFTIYNIACDETSIEDLVRCGGPECMVDLAFNSTEEVKVRAGKCMEMISAEPGVHSTLVDIALVTSIRECIDIKYHAEFYLSCAIMMANLSINADIHLDIIGQGALALCDTLGKEENPVVRQWIAMALCNFCSVPMNQDILTGSSRVMNLLSNYLVDTGSPQVVKYAAVAITNLSSTSRFHRILCKGKVLDPLIEIARTTKDALLEKKALLCLANLSAYRAAHETLVSRGFLDILVQKGNAREKLLLEYCSLGFCNLASSTQTHVALVNPAVLRTILKLCQGQPLRGLRSASATCRSLSSPAEHRKTLLKFGFLGITCSMAASHDRVTQLHAAATLYNLSFEPQAVVWFRKHINLELFVSFLDSPDRDLSCHFAFTLANICVDVAIQQCLIRKHNIFKILNSLLETSQNTTLYPQVARIFAMLSCRAENHFMMFKANTISHIVRFGMSTNSELRLYSALALRNLVSSMDLEINSRILQDGGLKPLVLLAASTNTVTGRQVSAAMCGLSYFREHKTVVVENGILPPLVSLLSSDDFETCFNAVCGLFSLSLNPANKTKIARQGAVPPLVNHASSDNRLMQKQVASVMASMSDETELHNLMISKGTALALVILSDCDNLEINKNVAYALANLTSTSFKNQKRADTDGATDTLIKFGSMSDLHLLRYSALALGNMCSNSSLIPSLYERGVVGVALQMLDTLFEEQRKPRATIRPFDDDASKEHEQGNEDDHEEEEIQIEEVGFLNNDRSNKYTDFSNELLSSTVKQMVGGVPPRRISVSLCDMICDKVVTQMTRIPGVRSEPEVPDMTPMFDKVREEKDEEWRSRQVEVAEEEEVETSAPVEKPEVVQPTQSLLVPSKDEYLKMMLGEMPETVAPVPSTPEPEKDSGGAGTARSDVSHSGSEGSAWSIDVQNKDDDRVRMNKRMNALMKNDPDELKEDHHYRRLHTVGINMADEIGPELVERSIQRHEDSKSFKFLGDYIIGRVMNRLTREIRDSFDEEDIFAADIKDEKLDAKDAVGSSDAKEEADEALDRSHELFHNILFLCPNGYTTAHVGKWLAERHGNVLITPAAVDEYMNQVPEMQQKDRKLLRRLSEGGLEDVDQDALFSERARLRVKQQDVLEHGYVMCDYIKNQSYLDFLKKTDNPPDKIVVFTAPEKLTEFLWLHEVMYKHMEAIRAGPDQTQIEHTSNCITGREDVATSMAEYENVVQRTLDMFPEVINIEVTLLKTPHGVRQVCSKLCSFIHGAPLCPVNGCEMEVWRDFEMELEIERYIVLMLTNISAGYNDYKDYFTHSVLKTILALMSWSNDLELQGLLTMAISNVVGNRAIHPALMAMGVVYCTNLIIIRHPQIAAKRQAAGVLATMAAQERFKQECVEEGALTSVSALVATEDSECVRLAMSVACDISFQQEATNKLLAHLPLQVILEIGMSEDCAVHPQVACLMANLARDERQQTEIVDKGGIQTIIHLVQSKSHKSRSEAARCIANISSNLSNQTGMVNQRITAPVIDMLRATDPEINRCAVLTLGNLALCSAGRIKIVEENGLPPLVRLLQSDMAEVQKYAALVLGLLAENDKNKEIIVMDVGLPFVTHAIFNSSSAEVRLYSALLLSLLAEIPINQRRVVTEVGVTNLFAMAHSDVPLMMRYGIITLTHLCNNSENKVSFMEEDIVSCLWRIPQVDDPETRQWAIALLANLTTNLSGHYLMKLVRNDFFKRVFLPLLQNETDPESQRRGGIAAQNLGVSPDVQKTIISEGLMEPMIAWAFSRAPSFELLSAHMLANFAKNPENRWKLVTSGALEALGRLVTLPNLQVQRHAVTGLSNLAEEEENLTPITRDIGLARFEDLSKSPDPEIQLHAALSLEHLAKHTLISRVKKSKKGIYVKQSNATVLSRDITTRLSKGPLSLVLATRRKQQNLPAPSFG